MISCLSLETLSHSGLELIVATMVGVHFRMGETHYSFGKLEQALIQPVEDMALNYTNISILGYRVNIANHCLCSVLKYVWIFFKAMVLLTSAAHVLARVTGF